MGKTLTVILTLLIAGCATTVEKQTHQSVSAPYCGCLLFIDDAKGIEDLNYARKFQPDFLLRSWYRWGEPSADKAYSTRQDLVNLASNDHIGIGGGTSLSFVNERDLVSPAFSLSWLSVNLDGSVLTRKDRKFASLSSPEFRSYLISKLLEQVKVGVKEIHLGEPNGELHFDDWTLGIKGNHGFIQWLKRKYSDKSGQWWAENFGTFGSNIHQNRPINRKVLLALSGKIKDNFDREYGKPGSWNGENSFSAPAFLGDLYKQNMQSFLAELREKLDLAGYEKIVIDIWGFADWMPKMPVQPNAYISTPPDERWKLNWSTDPKFDLEKNSERIKSLMENQMASVKPVPVIYMIDHSKPFDDFKKLPDERQAEITRFFLALTKEIGANFVFRSYKNDRNFIGPKTEEAIVTGCQQRKQNFCPRN